MADRFICEFTEDRRMILDMKFEFFRLEKESNREHFEMWCEMEACSRAQSVFRTKRSRTDGITHEKKWELWEAKKVEEKAKLMLEDVPGPSSAEGNVAAASS
jgi:hypothetical protein